METLEYSLIPSDTVSRLGLVVLQSDITLEDEFRYWFEGVPVNILVSRIPFETHVTVETLREMQDHISSSMSLFPKDVQFDCLAYCCTSGALHIGSDVIEQLVIEARPCRSVTNPMQAAVAAMQHMDAKRIAYISPYSAAVSQTMVDEFECKGIQVVAAATFDVHDKLVGLIDPASTKRAALQLIERHELDAVFVSCTNTKCASIIPEIEEETGVLTTSSNHVLAWELARRSGLEGQITGKGRLLEC